MCNKTVTGEPCRNIHLTGESLVYNHNPDENPIIFTKPRQVRFDYEERREEPDVRNAWRDIRYDVSDRLAHSEAGRRTTLTLSPKSVDNICQYRNKFEEFLRRQVNDTVGTFDPWKVAER